MQSLDLTPGRRIRAAMQLAGVESFGELARIVDTRNLGERTLRKIADDSDDSRNLQRLDAIALSEATGMPVSWFTAPTAALLAAIESAGQGQAPAQSGDLAERLAAVEEDLADLTKAVSAAALDRAAQAAEVSAGTTGDRAGRDRRRGRSGGASR